MVSIPGHTYRTHLWSFSVMSQEWHHLQTHIRHCSTIFSPTGEDWWNTMSNMVGNNL